ncbi:MAG: MarR family transcriptional regulator [Aeromicrobium sp.]|nr:MarR family transcriptional regulator [Burkholderiales bacterium]
MNKTPLSLKPQDLFVLLTMLAHGGKAPGYIILIFWTGLAPSVLHGVMKRAKAAGLMAVDAEGNYVVLKPQLKEFVLFGARYAFPAQLGGLTRGVPTSYAAAPLNSIIAPSADAVPVWPHGRGEVRGLALTPLHSNVPEVAMRDEKTHAVLSLFDAIRAGQTRERNAARELLEPYFQTSPSA